MGIFDLPPRTLCIVATILGLLMVDDLTAAEQNSLGNFIILIGQVLETNSAQQAVFSSRQQTQINQNHEERLKKLESFLNKSI